VNNIAFASIVELQKLVTDKKISHEELLEFFLHRFKQYDPLLGSAIEVFDKESILKFDSYTKKNYIHGIPGLIKDNICMKGRIASCASKILQNYRAPYNATAIERLAEVGALFIGRANMDEFAMGSSTATSAYQKTYNPWSADRVAGGSSGGSIAAVAAGLIPWALGSETGGSVRQPATLCGIVGLKPTYGLVSRYGLIAYASSLDQIGVATRTVYDNAIVLSVIAGHDVRDATSLPVNAIDFTQYLTGKIRPGLRIGVIENALQAPGMDVEVVEQLERALRDFEKLGATIERIKIPTMDYSAAAYFIMSRAEAASNLARFDGIRYGMRSREARNLEEVYELSRAQGFGNEVKLRILMGNYVLSVGHADEFYQRAKQVQQIMKQEFEQIFQKIDVLFSPGSPAQAFTFDSFVTPEQELQMDAQDYFSCSANLVGIPAIAVPCGFTKNKMPIGFQLTGPALAESLLLQTAYAYEQHTPWHTMHPERFV